MNPNLLDFRLREDSACVNAGAFLTQTTTSGSGTAIRVVDPKFFIDGYGIVDGDLIQLEGSTVKLRVVSADIVGGLLTVDQATSWTAGRGVTLSVTRDLHLTLAPTRSRPASACAGHERAHNPIGIFSDSMCPS